jgi:hypothetical protein
MVSTMGRKPIVNPWFQPWEENPWKKTVSIKIQ